MLDSSGAALPGATITLTNENTNQVADDRGGRERRLRDSRRCPAGSYKVEFSLQGFKTAAFNEVIVVVGQEHR